MKRHAPAARWMFSAGAVLGLSFGCTTIGPTTTGDVAPLTPGEQAKIDSDNAAQNARIDEVEASVDGKIAAIYPVSAVDVKLSEATVTALFGDANPLRSGDSGRKNSANDYVSAEQALRLMRMGTSSSGTSGGGGTAESTTFNNMGANTNSQTFETADTVQEAVNALRWASNIKIDQAGTSWNGTSISNVQDALADLDDQLHFAALGAGTNPVLSPTDAFPPIAEATDVRQALNALRFYPVPAGSGFITQFALPNGYMTEAVTSLDNRTKILEAFRDSVASGNTQITTASGVLYDTNNQAVFNAQVRKTDLAYSFPLEAPSLQGVVNELSLIIQNYRWTDNAKVDLARAPLNNSRWAPGSAIRNGLFALPAGDTNNSLDALLAKIDQELTDLDGRMGGGSSGAANAFGVSYDSSTADASTRVFSNSTNVGDALGALRHAVNIRFNVDSTLSAAGFPSGSNTVQTAIASAYTLNKAAIDQLRADTAATNNVYLTALTQGLFANSTFQSQLTQFINNSSGGSSGGASDTNGVALAGTTIGMFGTSMNVTGALTNIDQRLDAAEADIDQLQSDLSGVRNVTDMTFRNALRSFLLSDAMFLSGVASSTQVTTAINNGSGGGGGATILGVSANMTSGRMSFNGVTGLRAAAEMCKATTFGGQTFSTAHACTTHEVVAALPKATTALLDSLSPSNNTGGLWVWDNAKVTESGGSGRVPASRGATHRPANCQDFLYETGDIADATTGVIEQHQQGSSLMGYSPRFTQAAGCSTPRRVLCCR